MNKEEVGGAIDDSRNRTKHKKQKAEHKRQNNCIEIVKFSQECAPG
jgi:uncharacterized protein YjbJ (UPF0337 family)